MQQRERPFHLGGGDIVIAALTRGRKVRKPLWEAICRALREQGAPWRHQTKQESLTDMINSRTNNPLGFYQLRVWKEWGTLLTETPGESGGRLQTQTLHQHVSDAMNCHGNYQFTSSGTRLLTSDAGVRKIPFS